MYGSTKDVGYAKIKLGELLMERGHLYSKYLADAIDYLKSCDTEEAHRKTIEGMLLYLKIYKTDLYNINNYCEDYKMLHGNSEFLADVFVCKLKQTT